MPTLLREPGARRVPGADGLTLHLLDWGGSGMPLLFLHGFGMSARVWDPFAAALADRYRPLALDARGHGDSDHDPEFRYSHAALTRDVVAVADHLELERFAVVAHSMGGYAAIHYAARHPGRVARLALVDAGPDLPAGGAGSRGRREPVPVRYASPAEYEAVLARLHPQAAPDTLARLARHWLRERADGHFEPKLDPAFLRPRSAGDPANRRDFDRASWAREEGERLWRRLGAIDCPTLVVRGEYSRMLSAGTATRMVRESLRDARCVTVGGAGHAVPLDAPEALGDALRAFLPGA